MNTYLQEFEKYKDYQLPPVGVNFKHPTEYRSSGPIEYRVKEYNENGGLVETVHSLVSKQRTLHWIRKVYNTPASPNG